MFNFVTLGSVLTDDLAKDLFIEMFRIYCGARSLMAWNHPLLENEKLILKFLCYNILHCSQSIFLKTL